VVIEIKLARNAEARRAVGAQVLTYAAHLKGLDPTLLEGDLVDGYLREHESLPTYTSYYRLFTRVPGRVILRSPYAEPCIGPRYSDGVGHFEHSGPRPRTTIYRAPA
jgi:hypothetical protein